MLNEERIKEFKLLFEKLESAANKLDIMKIDINNLSDECQNAVLRNFQRIFKRLGEVEMLNEQKITSHLDESNGEQYVAIIKLLRDNGYDDLDCEDFAIDFLMRESVLAEWDDDIRLTVKNLHKQLL